MIKKTGALLGLFAGFVILLSGCETTKGIAHSVGYTIDSTAKGAASDVKGFWQTMKKIDTWMQDELW